MKAALVYLKVSNFGDLVIYDTARYLTERIFAGNGIEAEIVTVDMGSYQPRLIAKQNKSKGGKLKLQKKLWHLWKKSGLYSLTPDLSEKLVRKAWRRTVHYKYFREHEQKKLEEADVIIFCGGGLIKYHQQNFHFYLDEITKIAEEKHIPVIMNAVGIEGYSERNPECRLLKKAINRDCMVSITVRDDIDLLENKYITNHEIMTERVCDPAFWTQETYDIKADPDREKNHIIGLNLIRPKIFKEYMYDVSEEELIRLYADIINKLNQKGYKVTLFSNGVEADDRLGRNILSHHPELKDTDCFLPSSPEELVRFISKCERVIAVRLHASIISTVLGIPNVSLVWNRKQPLFGSQVKMEENYLTKDQFDADLICERLLNAVPYQMNEEYKMSVLKSLERAVLKAGERRGFKK